MARKMNIPKAKQIQGLRKAIANRKTPRQFIPSMKKRLAKLTGAAAILFALLVCAAHPAAAQTPVIIQPTQQVLATAVNCTGTSQTFPVNNKNQTRHYASIITTNVQTLTMQINGVDSSGNSFLISDIATNGAVSSGANPVLTAVGYYPTINVVVNCAPITATFTLSYSGSSAASGELAGGYLLTQVDKTLAFGSPAGTNVNFTFQPPYGNSVGTLIFNFAGASGPAGSTITVGCIASGETVAATATNFTFLLATASGVQSIPIPPSVCPVVNVNYNAGGAGAGTIRIDYVFAQPGGSTPASYTHITGTTATVVKGGSGIVHSVVVGTPAVGTISLFDLVPGSCTGTPATNVVSVITATATFPSAPEIYDTLFLNGICVKASAAMDITVSSQ
jgi:hypothetical protein